MKPANSGLKTIGEYKFLFQFSNDIRRIMYTTNIIEELNCQYRKITKTKSVFPSDAALEKMLFLVSENAVNKWSCPQGSPSYLYPIQKPP